MRTLVTISLMLGCAAGQTLSPEVRNFVKTDAPVIALTHVRVIDGTGSAPREDQTVVLSKGKLSRSATLRPQMFPKRRRCSTCTATA